MARASERDISDSIERLEFFEERYGVKLESLSAISTRRDSGVYNIDIFGEIFPRSGTLIEQDLEIVGSLHDDEGKMIALEDQPIGKERFFGFQAFNLIFLSVIAEPKNQGLCEAILKSELC